MGWWQAAVGLWQVAVLHLFLSLTILQNEHRKMKHGAKFIREIPTDSSVGKFKNFEFSLHSSRIRKKILKIFNIFRWKFLQDSFGNPSGPVGKKSIGKSVGISANLSESVRIPLEIPMHLFSVGKFHQNKLNF